MTVSDGQNLESGDSKMKQNGNIEAITVAGMLARSLQLATVSPVLGRDGSKQAERDWLVVVAAEKPSLSSLLLARRCSLGRLQLQHPLLTPGGAYDALGDRLQRRNRLSTAAIVSLIEEIE